MENKAYCELIYPCNFSIPENSSLKKSRTKRTSSDLKNCYYYEEYVDFDSFIRRINFIYLSQIQGYAKLGVDILSDKCSFKEFSIRNKYERYLQFGVSSYGWNISVYFYSYLSQFFEKHYGKENVLKTIKEKTKQDQVWFYSSNTIEPNIYPAYYLVSEETALIILKKFFEGIYEPDLDPDIYHREIEKRNYLS